MNNAELIKVLRKCGKQSPDRCWDCEYYDREPWCESALVNDAADALEAADKRIAELDAQIPKEGEWLRTDAFPHRVYCSCCYKTYVPNENWQIWQDDADNFGLPRNYCPNCGAKMKYENQTDSITAHEDMVKGVTTFYADNQPILTLECSAQEK